MATSKDNSFLSAPGSDERRRASTDEAYTSHRVRSTTESQVDTELARRRLARAVSVDSEAVTGRRFAPRYVFPTPLFHHFESPHDDEGHDEENETEGGGDTTTTTNQEDERTPLDAQRVTTDRALNKMSDAKAPPPPVEDGSELSELEPSDENAMADGPAPTTLTSSGSGIFMRSDTAGSGGGGLLMPQMKLGEGPRRNASSVSMIGREGQPLAPKSYRGSSLAVFTSGGDSQGMNSAVRAVVRMGLYLGCRVYFIYEGYQGMVNGGDNIKEADWNSVSDIIQQGGTIIGSARCKDFRERAGRLTACANLCSHNITNLVCIGGDGSLTGADMFRQEWQSLLQELVETGRVDAAKQQACSNINIVGLVGSIDNDFCGTDMTIGTDSALHRIIECVDNVSSTAQSHQRCFVIEVMGRHCGYLALVAALASEADWCFIPEWPPSPEWPDVMCKKLDISRSLGQRLNIVIVAEGAQDCKGQPITCEQVKDVIQDKLNYDTRVTVLGHVQRGGYPSAFDRLLGCRMGAEAVLALMEMTPETEPCVISIDGNQMVRVPLMQCVQRTKEVQKAMDEKNWEMAVQLRGRSFQRNLNTYKLLTKVRPPEKNQSVSEHSDVSFNVGVMNIGAPSGGMNACVRAFVRISLYHRCRVFGIHNSFEGLAHDQVKEMYWGDCTNWVMHGGSFLGTQKHLPSSILPDIAKQLRKYNIQSLLICGGFEGYNSALILAENRHKYPEFQIPVVVIPCTISNNVPGTSLSLGSDTALNEICSMIDKIKQSATGTKKRVFIIETMGGYCGYLATLSALASGADNAYIFEERFNVDDIKEDVRVIAQKMKKGVQRYLIVRSEGASKNYTTQFVMQLFSEEGKGEFSTRTNVLGHAQQGGAPSPFDRNMGTKMAARCVEYLVQQMKANYKPELNKVFTPDANGVVLLALQGRHVVFEPVMNLKSDSDFDSRLPKDQWWLKLRPLLRILAKHDSIYESDAVALRSVESVIGL